MKKHSNAVNLTYVILLNWNGWKDTIECLESVFRLDFPCFRVIVCDNASNDGSLEKIKSWAEGRLATPAFGVQLGSSSYTLHKPIQWVEYTREQAEAGGSIDEEAQLVLIQTGANLGFAGGNNVALRYAVSRSDFDYAWILNNDTVVEPDALSQLVKRMQDRPDAGMCGSTLVYYHKPDTVQALAGAAYDKRKAQSSHIGVFQPVGQQIDIEAVEQKMAYVIGASMLVSRQFLDVVGLMCEDYFLYYEEIDWACRARGKFTLAYAPDSIVYHKEGASIGSSHSGKASTFSLQLLYRNRLRFVLKFHRRFFPLNVAYILFEMLVFLKRKQFQSAGIVAMALLGRLENVISSKE